MSNALKKSFMAAALSASLFGLSAGHVLAQNATISVLRAPALLSDAAIASFVASPCSILGRHPTGGIAMAREIRGLVGSDLALLDAVLGCASEANSAQLSAIGAGLAQVAQAALAESVDNPDAIEAAERIQLAIASLGIPEVVTAFNAVVGATLTAAVRGPGPAQGGGGFGGQGQGGGGPIGVGGGAGVGGGGGGGTGGGGGGGGNPSGGPPSFVGGGGGSFAAPGRNLGVPPGPPIFVINLPPGPPPFVPSPSLP